MTSPTREISKHDSSDLLTIGSYTFAHEAHLVKTQLESAGIETFLLGEHLSTINWLGADAFGGVKVSVKRSDYELAREVLSFDLQKKDEEDTGWGTCRGCGSGKMEVRVNKRLSSFVTFLLWAECLRAIAYLLLLFSRPRKQTTCLECGNRQ